MSDYATAPRAANENTGTAAMTRLAERLAAVTPPPAMLDLTDPIPLPKPSPAVAAALATAKALAERADRRARRSRSITGLLVDGFVALCSFLPYTLIALALRLLMAREFFLDGQTLISGPRLAQSLYGFNFSAVLPMQVRAETFSTFLTQYAALPVPPVLAAYVVSYAEFVLPILLVFGFATRLSALALLVMIGLIDFYVMPQALWTEHIYWGAILLILVSRGPGALSIDHFIKLAAHR
ncbi:MAG TPA: DoxX family protein [Pseudolabrys sp.]|nr:DoxX family protein [Pseudolabrys sp.]